MAQVCVTEGRAGVYYECGAKSAKSPMASRLLTLELETATSIEAKLQLELGEAMMSSSAFISHIKSNKTHENRKSTT